jgi:quinol monooxygenase YgiN
MAKLTVVAKITAHEDSVDSVKTELLKLITPTRKEEGCIEYSLHQDNADPTVFIFYETWENAACLDRHMNSEHFREFVAAVGSLLADKVIHLMTRIEPEQ